MAYPPIFDGSGYTPFSQAEAVAFWTSKWQSIYGADINLNSNSPEGLLMNAVVQAQLDMQDKFMQGNASFDPDQAIGMTLASRVGINGIQVQAGTFSKVAITLVTTQALALVGLDALIANPNASVYTIADGAGTQWQLMASVTIAAAGSQVLNFQAQLPGATLAQAGTITNPVSVVVGVQSVTNLSAVVAPNIGTVQETDAALRLRRQTSTSIGAIGVAAALRGVLLNIPGVTYAKIYVNNLGIPADINGNPGVSGAPGILPRNSIWVVVAGPADSGTRQLIANAINVTVQPGPSFKGATQGSIVQPDGTTTYVYWDYVTPQRTYVKFNAHSINGIDSINAPYIAAQLALLYVPGIGATLDQTSFGTAVQGIDPNCDVSGAQFSTDGVTYIEPLPPTQANFQFTIQSGDIAITVI